MIYNTLPNRIKLKTCSLISTTVYESKIASNDKITLPSLVYRAASSPPIQLQGVQSLLHPLALSVALRAIVVLDYIA